MDKLMAMNLNFQWSTLIGLKRLKIIGACIINLPPVKPPKLNKDSFQISAQGGSQYLQMSIKVSNTYFDKFAQNLFLQCTTCDGKRTNRIIQRLQARLFN